MTINPEIDGVFQPGPSNLRQVLRATLDDVRFDTFILFSAWMRASALTDLSKQLKTFRGRGGKAVGIAGLSLGGATEEGLAKMMEVFDEPYVAFDVTGRTVHPKMMLATGTSHCRLFIGSQNMTMGGLVRNYEAGLTVTWSTAPPFPSAFVDALKYVNSIRNTTSLCKPLTNDLLDVLLTDPGISIGSELRSPAPDGSRRAASTVFAEDTEAISISELAASGVTGEGEIAWSKTIPAADAQRLPTASPSAHIALTNAPPGSNVSSYFRNELFGDLDWVAEGDRETSTARFRISGIPGSPSVVELRIDHTPSWGSDQGNRATTIRWGSELMKLLRGPVDITGKTLEIRRAGPAFYDFSVS